MTGLDKLFEKSNTSESKKKSKMIFGKLLIALRKRGAIKLYSMLGGVVDSDIVDKSLVLFLKDTATFDMINNQDDCNSINEELKEICPFQVELRCLENKIIDENAFEEFLKKEFGKILTIKGKEN